MISNCLALSGLIKGKVTVLVCRRVSDPGILRSYDTNNQYSPQYRMTYLIKQQANRLVMEQLLALMITGATMSDDFSIRLKIGIVSGKISNFIHNPANTSIAQDTIIAGSDKDYSSLGYGNRQKEVFVFNSTHKEHRLKLGCSL